MLNLIIIIRIEIIATVYEVLIVLCWGCRESVDNTVSCSHLEPIVRKAQSSQTGGDQAIGY